MINQIVARYQDGRIVKGATSDFLPAKDRFHLVPQEAVPGDKPLEIMVSDLKALFFVRDYAGNPGRRKSNEFNPGKPVPGRKIRVVFKDGETLVGTTQGYQPGRPGFFLVPADEESNNSRCYVVSSSAKEISFI